MTENPTKTKALHVGATEAIMMGTIMKIMPEHMDKTFTHQANPSNAVYPCPEGAILSTKFLDIKPSLDKTGCSKHLEYDNWWKNSIQEKA